MKTDTTTLSSQATPVPSATRVSMVEVRVLTTARMPRV